MLKHTKNAFFYSMSGLNAAIKEEVAFRLVLAQAALIFLFIIFSPFSLSYIEISFLITSAAICIIIELLNSAIENIVDLITSDWHLLAKKAKDMGSAAQFIALVLLYTQIAFIIKNHI